jgi:putative transposase
MHWVCYAYCLMTNHYHLVIETLDPNLSRGMRQLNGVYTQRFNRQHGRVGHVFQGRYKAILVDRESYLLELVRYVVLNPVRAGMVTSPEQWHWSSYHATAGQAHAPDWLATEWVLRQFGTRQPHAHARFDQFVRDGQIRPSIWHGLRNQIYSGDESFVARMQSQIQAEKPLDEIPKVQRRMCRLSLEDFARQYGNQHAAMAEAYLSGAHTMKAIASYFGVHYSTVSRAISGVERRRGK